ncbi:Uncharacterised protein [Pseudomonas aeruginosa]|nr:Uncharacterised protein [Pseudomonas aeruginosa]
MQQAARRFIEKHAAEHLDDDGLFERTVSYLVNSLDVPAFMAGRLALLAMSERLPKGLAWVAFDMAAGPDQSVRMVLDRRTGQFTRCPLASCLTDSWPLQPPTDQPTPIPTPWVWGSCTRKPRNRPCQTPFRSSSTCPSR